MKRTMPYALAGAMAIAAVVRAQVPLTPPPVFRSSADLVTIDVVVTTSGTPVAGLRAGDFVLTDNGVPQSLEVVALEAVPATVTMILDIGDFMSETIRSFVDDVRNIAAMVRPDDNVRLMAVDTYVRDLVPLRKSSDWPRIDRIATNGLASAHDALAAAIMRQHDPDRQHLIIAMTNGVDTGSVLDMNALTEIARRSSAPLYIVPADLVLESIGPPKRYSTRRERGMGLGRIRRRFWMPFHDRHFERQEEATRLTGGDWIMPGMFENTGASDIFENFYKTHRRSYRLTYTPKGVPREGWHAVSVTVPRYPSYTVSAKPGYAGESRPAPTIAADNRPAAATIDGLVAGYDRDDYAAFVDGLRQVSDFTQLIEAFDKGGNPWPDRPQREAAFVLEVSQAALASGQRNVAVSVGKLLDRHRLLVRDPLGPDSFEKFWLWTAVGILEGVNEPALAQSFVSSALERFPDEPRLLLAHAFILDRRLPFAWGPARSTDTFITSFSSGVSRVTRITTPTGMPDSHVREVSSAYDAAIALPSTAAEARIRKSLLLLRAGRREDALALLDAEATQPADAGLQYFRDLFRGRILTELGSVEKAETAYRAALVLAPQAQSPRVALMALALQRGDHAAATTLAEEIQAAPAAAWDPWWGYWQGDSRMVATALARLRMQTR